MNGNNVKKDHENGQLSCRIYSPPAVAGLLCKVGSAIARYTTNHKTVFVIKEDKDLKLSST